MSGVEADTGFEQSLLEVFGTLVLYLDIPDIARLRRTCKSLCTSSDSDEIWRSLSVRDFGCAPPCPAGMAKKAYRFLSNGPRAGDLFEINLSTWVAARAVLRLDDRHVLAIPTNCARRPAYVQYVWIDMVDDCERVRALSEATTVAPMHSGRAEQREMFARAQRIALEKLAAGATPQWPVWDSSMFGLAEYRYPQTVDPFDEESPVWCSLAPELCTRPKRFLADPLWRELQVPCRLLRTSHSVVVDPQVGEILQVMDSVNKWFAAMITAHQRGSSTITVTYEGWGPEWDETVNIYAASHRLRAFGDEHVDKGPGESFARDTLPRAVFIPWDAFVHSPHFNPSYFLPEPLSMIEEPQVGAILEVLNMRNEPCAAEIVAVTGNTIRIRYDGLEQTEDLHIIRDRHRLGALSTRSASGDTGPIIDRTSRKRLEIVDVPYSEKFLADVLYPY
eukprot:m51a1_g12932 hypothetical protein (448) ;mRNA; f:1211-2782